jgi:hypothetical protein
VCGERCCRVDGQPDGPFQIWQRDDPLTVQPQSLLVQLEDRKRAGRIVRGRRFEQQWQAVPTAEISSILDVDDLCGAGLVHRRGCDPLHAGVPQGFDEADGPRHPPRIEHLHPVSPLILRDEMLGNPIGGMSGRSDGDHACQLRREPWGSEQPLNLGGQGRGVDEVNQLLSADTDPERFEPPTSALDGHDPLGDTRVGPVDDESEHRAEVRADDIARSDDLDRASDSALVIERNDFHASFHHAAPRDGAAKVDLDLVHLTLCDPDRLNIAPSHPVDEIFVAVQHEAVHFDDLKGLRGAIEVIR